jgi:hypothetical protein
MERTRNLLNHRPSELLREQREACVGVGGVKSRQYRRTNPAINIDEWRASQAVGRRLCTPLPTRFQAALILESFLERQSHITILCAGDDLGMAPLDFYVKEIYRASPGILHLLAPKRVRAAEHNAC